MIGDLIFVRGNSLTGKLIEEFDGYFSHVCVSLAPNNNRILEAQGMVRSRIVPFYFDDYEIVELNLSDEQKELALKVGIQLCGFKYDYARIVGIGLEDLFNFKIHNFMDNPNKYTCFELVDLFLYGIGWIEDEEYLGDMKINEFYKFVKSKL
jgi:hypothetical protein